MKKYLICAVAAALLACFSLNAQTIVMRVDDIGSFHSANKATIDCYQNGIAKSTELMIVAPWAPEAIKMVNDNPGLDVGLHLVLNSEWENYKWRPLTICPSVCDENGYFLPMMSHNDAYPGLALLEATPDIKEIEAEFRAQIELAIKLVHNLTHLSGHMGAAGFNDDVTALVSKLAKEYNLPLYNANLVKNDYELKSVRYVGESKTSAQKIKSFIKMLSTLEEGKTYYFVDHPAYNDCEMETVFHIGYEDVAIDRQGVTDALTSPKVKKYIQKHGIKVVSIGEMVKPYRK